MRCSACGAAGPRGARFCPGCGARLSEPGPAASVGSLDRAQALIKATAALAAGLSGEPGAMLDTLCDQARRLLAADQVALDLVAPGSGELERRQRGGAAAGEAGRRAGRAPDPLVQEAIAARRPVFRVDGGGGARLVAPLVADDELVGALSLAWSDPVRLAGEELELAELLAAQAAIAVRAGRAVEAERDARRRADELLEIAQRMRARAEANEARLATIVEHLPSGLLILDAAGRVIMINEAGRRITGEAPSGQAPLAEQQAALAVRDARTGQPFAPGETAMERALRNEPVEGQEMLVRPAGADRDRRLQVSAVPLRDRVGGVRGAVVVCTDVTELHEAVAERARLDGAVKTARLITHDLNNKLTAVLANADLLFSDLTGEPAALAAAILQGAEQSAEIVARLNEIVRFEETDVGLGVPVLDLEAATRGARPTASG